MRGKDLFFLDPESRQLVSTDGRGQITERLEIAPIALSVEHDAAALMRRDPAEVGQTERRRNVQGNQLVVKGTRVPVSSILNLAADGYDPDQIANAYPSLVVDDVTAIRTDYATPRVA